MSEGTDNGNVIVLPEHLFTNLIDTELQRRIAYTGNMDYNTAEAIRGLLEEGPNKAKKDLEDWEVEEFKGKNILFYKGKNYIPNDSQLRHNIVQKYHDCYNFSFLTYLIHVLFTYASLLLLTCFTYMLPPPSPYYMFHPLPQPFITHITYALLTP